MLVTVVGAGEIKTIPLKRRRLVGASAATDWKGTAVTGAKVEVSGWSVMPWRGEEVIWGAVGEFWGSGAGRSNQRERSE